MASQANIAINDGQATPVSHTFYTNGAGWSDSLQGILASWVDVCSSDLVLPPLLWATGS